jgi:hypothetical protein
MDGSFERVVSTRRTNKESGGRAMKLKGFPSMKSWMSEKSFFISLTNVTLGDTEYIILNLDHVVGFSWLLKDNFLFALSRTLKYNTTPYHHQYLKRRNGFVV